MWKSVIGSIRKRSLLYKLFLILALVLMAVRMGVHGVYLNTLLASQERAGSSYLGSGDFDHLPLDLGVYLQAGWRFRQQEPLYPDEDLEDMMIYQYSPSFALVFSVVLFIPPPILLGAITGLYFLGFITLFLIWGQYFRTYRLRKALNTLIWLLPVWLLYSAFWVDLGFMNLYIMMALLASLLIFYVIEEKLLPAAVILCLILLSKPHYAFPALVPLLFKRHRFFLKMLLLAMVGYVAMSIITVLVAGVTYGVAQYRLYLHFLTNLSRDFPFSAGKDGLLGYNHSVKQVLIYYLGNSRRVWIIADAVKYTLLVPLGAALMNLYRGEKLPSPREAPLIAMDAAFGLYLGVFIWLDMVWELTFGIIVFVFCYAYEKRAWLRLLLGFLFLVYAFADLWQVLSVALFGMDVLVKNSYIRTDPHYYVPILLVLILVLYYATLSRMLNRKKHLSKINA